MNIRNFNQPRPRWAAATSKLLRVLTVAVAAAFYANDSATGTFIAVCGGAVADFILDLFPNHSDTNQQETNDN